MNKYKAYVRDKESKETKIIESEYKNKQLFINDLRKNGYVVYPSNVSKIY